MNFKQKLIAFMYGRYGIDSLYYALLCAYCVLTVILAFRLPLIVRLVFTALQLFSIVCMFYRFLSRNHAKRRHENEVFLRYWQPAKKKLVLWKNMIRDVKNYRYKTCPHCKATLRLPKRKGEHTVVCPCCKERFTVKVRF